jgi:hypothetical protein
MGKRTLEDAIEHLYGRCSPEIRQKVDDIIEGAAQMSPKEQGEAGEKAVKLLMEEIALRLSKYNN